jgi:hypothetical protein
MKLIPQKDKLNVVNFDRFAETSTGKKRRRHGNLLPSTIRCLICGPSNCGKTNLMFNLLCDENGLNFKNLYVFSKSLNQPKYRFLTRLMKGIPEIGYFTFNENDNVIHPNKAKPKSVMVFDDVALEKQDNIRNYFAMGRHNELDTFYLGQTYSRIPKQLIRDNANIIVVFKQDSLNLQHIYNDHVNTDMTFTMFKDICSKAWNAAKNAFVVIDKDSDINTGRYRVGFDTFVQV